jgi:RimJ/RimL family protein N-acetyltransferase
VILETERLILRPWRDTDRVPFARINADPRVMEFLSAPLSPEKSGALMDRAIAHFERHGFGPWAAQLKTDGSLIGFIGLMVPTFEGHFTPCVEIGWRLVFDFQGQRLATEGAQEVLQRGFADFGLDQIVSFTATGNTRSRRVMEKLGMSHNPADDFDHPRVREESALKRHVLYRAARTLNV